MNPRNTEVVKNCPKPLTPTYIRSFLGLAGYYRRFVEDFFSIDAPLSFDEEESQKLKDRLTSALVLILPKCSENYTIYCDASSVLMQGS